MKKPLLLLVSLVLATGAVAQENPTKLALAREVIAAMKADQMFDNMAGQMKAMAAQAMTPPAGATPEQIKMAEELQGKVMDLSMQAAKGMIAQMDHIYAEIYSEVELKAMKDFFSSAAGQSMLAKQPQIMGRIMPLAQQMQRDLAPKIKALVDEARAKAQAAAAAAAPAAAPAGTPQLPPLSPPTPAPAPATPPAKK